MLPINNFINNEVEIIKEPNFTYKLNIEKENIRKNIDNIEAIKQAIYKILMTERYVYTAYNWNYGIELNDLIGKDKSFVKAELPRRIKEALMLDDRIKDVENFSFEDIDKTTLCVTFSVQLYDFEDLEIKFNVKV